jgi:hypothetical protein
MLLSVGARHVGHVNVAPQGPFLPRAKRAFAGLYALFSVELPDKAFEATKQGSSDILRRFEKR